MAGSGVICGSRLGGNTAFGLDGMKEWRRRDDRSVQGVMMEVGDEHVHGTRGGVSL